MIEKLKEYRLLILSLLIIFIVALIVVIPLIKEHFRNKNELILYGNIEIRQVDLGFRVSGRIEKMLFEEGDMVKKGDLIAMLESNQYYDIWNQAKAEAKAKFYVQKNADITFSRNHPLCDDTTISKQECDDLLTQKNQSKAEYDSAVANVDAAQADYLDTRIYAPCDGTVMTRVQEPGAIVSPSQIVYTVAKNKPVWIRAFVPEPELGRIKYGMQVKVYNDSRPNNPYTGWIGYISPVAEFTPKEVETATLRTDLVYRIRVYIYDVDEYLRQGMPVTVKIDLAGKQTIRKVVDDNG
ncbi:MAG: efflux RND transporter periplasmic adaptor subunit [Candidatus Gastranaerophilales bacterium]|nr:efflux RND transporter periplasmic adaptor subunit [Candidatus Gastranaerophilales bacterium]